MVLRSRTMPKHLTKRRHQMKRSQLLLVSALVIAGVSALAFAISSTSPATRANELIDRLESDLRTKNQLTYGEILNAYGKPAGSYIWKIDGEHYAITIYQFGDTYFEFVKRIEHREVICVEVVHGYRTAPSFDYMVYVYDEDLYNKVLQSRSYVKIIDVN